MVRRKRLDLGLSNGELARKARIDPSQLSKMQRNQIGASMPALRRLARALKVPITELYAEKLEPLPEAVSPAAA